MIIAKSIQNGIEDDDSEDDLHNDDDDLIPEQFESTDIEKETG